ncbi:unnamed protein product, partial [Allacma fusca]
MTAISRYLTIVSILLVCFSRYSNCKSFYTDYDEDVMPEIYTIAGTKVVEEGEPDGVFIPRATSSKVRVHGGEFVPWTTYPVPTPETSSWDMEVRPRRDQ